MVDQAMSFFCVLKAMGLSLCVCAATEAIDLPIATVCFPAAGRYVPYRHNRLFCHAKADISVQRVFVYGQRNPATVIAAVQVHPAIPLERL